MLEQVAAALYASPLISVSAAFLWGLLSVLLSPCHLSVIPLIMAYINQNSRLSVKQGFYVSLSFSFGIMLTLMAMVALVLSIGIMFSGIENFLKIMVSVLLFAGGLYFLGVLPDFRGKDLISYKFNDRPYRSALIAGLIIGMGLGSCALAFMAPVLSLSVSKFTEIPLFSIGIVIAYILGHCLIIALSGLFISEVKSIFKWGQRSNGTKVIKYISGILMLLFAVYNIVKM